MRQEQNLHIKAKESKFSIVPRIARIGGGTTGFPSGVTFHKVELVPLTVHMPGFRTHTHKSQTVSHVELSGIRNTQALVKNMTYQMLDGV